MINLDELRVNEMLTMYQQFRLVEIAHETNDIDIKTAAITILKKSLAPPLMVAAEEIR